MNADLVSTILKENLQLANLSLASDDFQSLNIYGNRIMSDSVFMQNRESAIIGFFIKHVALNFLYLQTSISKQDLLDVKLVAKNFMDSIPHEVEDINVEHLFLEFHEFNQQVKRHFVSDTEKDVYDVNPEITDIVRLSLVNLLVSNKELLCNPNNNIINGLIGELERFCKAYDYQSKDTLTFCILVALDRYYGYFRYHHSTTDGKVDKEKTNTIISPYIENIRKLVTNADINYDDFTELMWELIKGWREFFIFYGETPNIKPQQPITLPEESRQKLSKAFSKALEKEIKP